MKDFGSAFQTLLDAFPLLAYQVKYLQFFVRNMFDNSMIKQYCFVFSHVLAEALFIL